ncbi:HAMP domain-containing protein [Algibacter amylolyticus]|uniref:histidine kinase n=2 Tax=Algibacter amylolyticus TaxID=1608400 RepID=A0A5M7AXZ4_9FLAO|nr:HAMP domain-containing protein [Algibacter amylolyticus]TSJ73453.1 HAMP domain-containing protein [Algibacter amylolyticus]
MLFKNLSIKFKMILVIQLVSLFSLVIGLTYVIFSNIANFKEDMKNNTIINANLIGEYCAVSLDFDVSENAVETLEKLKNIPSVDVGIVYNNDNEIFADFYADGEKVVISNTNSSDSWENFDANFLSVFRPIYIENSKVGSIYLRVSTEVLSLKIRDYVTTMLLLLVGLLIANYLLAYWLQKIVSEPIIHLTKATKEISEKGNYQMRVEKQGNDEIGVLVDEYNKMLLQIYEREESLKQRTTELTETLANLKQTQQKLVNSEKLAALGQVIAGVAHEINTPLGAIRSSIGNIKNTLNFVLNEYPIFINELPEKLRVEFLALMEDSFKNRHMLTSKEERVFKKKIAEIFENHNIKNAYSFADTFVDMMVVEGVEKYLDLLKTENSEKILEVAYKITGLQRSTENIEFAAERASKVVFALKNSSRINNNDEQMLADITEGIENILTLYNNQIKQGIEVSKSYDKVPKILCYYDELNQVWTNILHNAIYAMELSGKLDIKVYTEKDWVVVSITDNGKGIPKDEINRIFEPFFSTKPTGEGTGIGLDISKRIIEKHNGKIEVESKPGKTTFSVYLPTMNRKHDSTKI